MSEWILIGIYARVGWLIGDILFIAVLLIIVLTFGFVASLFGGRS